LKPGQAETLARPKIDAHQHFWKYNPARDGWITGEMSELRRNFLPGELMQELSANRMDASVAVQASQSEEETVFLLDLAAEFSGIAGVVGWVDLRADTLEKRLEYFSRFEKLRGFRHIVQAESDDRFMLRSDFARGISRLKEFGFAYDILIYPKQMPAAIELAGKFPEQPFVLDHAAKPHIKTREIAVWTEQIKKLAAAPNVWCKLSGLVTEADWMHWRPEDFRPYLDVVFEAFGPRRVMFGSDWPVCLLAGTYSQVKQLVMDYARDCAPTEKESIFGGNAIRFYGLEKLLRARP
jgi:L-fuconolactonase